MQIDFSATPYTVTGSGQKRSLHYFPHIITNFELVEAIKQGLVKTVAIDKRKEIAALPLEFKADREEIIQILKERVSYGLRPNSIGENILSIVAGMADGDARVGLQILKVAARDAESKYHETISLDEIKSAAKCARKYRMSYLLGKLNEPQRTIYEILRKSKKMSSGKLFEECRKSSNQILIDRSYRNYMQRMVELELVRESGTGRWKRYEIVV